MPAYCLIPKVTVTIEAIITANVFMLVNWLELLLMLVPLLINYLFINMFKYLLIIYILLTYASSFIISLVMHCPCMIGIFYLLEMFIYLPYLYDYCLIYCQNVLTQGMPVGLE